MENLDKDLSSDPELMIELIKKLIVAKDIKLFTLVLSELWGREGFDQLVKQKLCDMELIFCSLIKQCSENYNEFVLIMIKYSEEFTKRSGHYFDRCPLIVHLTMCYHNLDLFKFLIKDRIKILPQDLRFMFDTHFFTHFVNKQRETSRLQLMLKFIVEDLDSSYFPFNDKGKLLEFFVFLIFNKSSLYLYQSAISYIISKMDAEKHCIYHYRSVEFGQGTPFKRAKRFLGPIWAERLVPISLDGLINIFGECIRFIPHPDSEYERTDDK